MELDKLGFTALWPHRMFPIGSAQGIRIQTRVVEVKTPVHWNDHSSCR